MGDTLVRRVRRLCAISGPVLVVGVFASSAAASGWSVENTANPPGASAQLSAVSCSSARACTAVGIDVKSDGTNVPLAERWNGHRWIWQRTPHPSGSTTSYLLGVSCPSRRVCVAVGVGNGMLVERWNGLRWSIQHAPNPPHAKFVQVQGVSCSSGRACTAIGGYVHRGSGADGGRTLAERWNGVRWAIQRTPVARHQSAELGSVSCPTSQVCTAIGTSGSTVRAWRWNGERWSIQRIPRTSGPAEGGVSCPSRRICTAVAASDNPPPAAWRWNGTKWSTQPTPAVPYTSAALRSVSCTSGRACVAVGAGSFQEDPPSPENLETLAERWNGTKWAIQRTPNPGQLSELSDVSCPSSRVCVAVGGYTVHRHYVTLAERWQAH